MSNDQVRIVYVPKYGFLFYFLLGWFATDVGRMLIKVVTHLTKEAAK